MPARIIDVSNAGALQRALEGARPGDVIRLADGTYTGRFSAATSGTRAAPITLQGSRRAVLDGDGVKGGYAFHLTADYWVLRGFSITNAQKGLMADAANHNLIDGLAVFHIGDEAIHFRSFSTRNTVQNCVIHDTGLRRPKFGEGVYLGSAVSNWRKHSNGNPDASDFNRVLNNRFGPNVRAEAIDIKEGSRGGEIRGNVFDGRGMSGENYADSWVDVKGNSYLIAENRGSRATRDGFQTHVILDGWGRDNVFRANHADVQAEGLGFRIHLNEQRPRRQSGVQRQYRRPAQARALRMCH